MFNRRQVSCIFMISSSMERRIERNNNIFFFVFVYHKFFRITKFLSEITECDLSVRRDEDDDFERRAQNKTKKTFIDF